MPASWHAIIDDRLPFAAFLEGEERERWLRHLKIFAWEKNFEGIRLDVTDEMRVMVSGCAARLSRNIGIDIYDELSSVLMYPSTIALPRSHSDGHLQHDEVAAALGVHSTRGAVILAWDAVQQGLRFPNDGQDVVLHELAHAIDADDGVHDGTPPLSRSADVHAWAKVFSESYFRLQDAVRGTRRQQRKHPVDPYGATNEAEFFATATEAFFERPKAMRRREPELYAELCKYYRVDPAADRQRSTA